MTTKLMTALPAAVSAGKSIFCVGLSGFTTAAEEVVAHEAAISNTISNLLHVAGNGIEASAIITDEWADSSDEWLKRFAEEHGRVIIR